MRLPKHIGTILDGSRRWVKGQGMDKSEGYGHGIPPGMSLYRTCQELGTGEMSFYGLVTNNTKRPSAQGQAFTRVCAAAVEELAKEDANLFVLGNTEFPMFPHELLPFTVRHDLGKDGMKIDLLVNYSWGWDLGYKDETIEPGLKTVEVSRIDLIIRWDGGRRLSGFLPMQSVYSDFYTVDDYWPDFRRKHVEDVLKWHTAQDITLGG